MADDVTIEVSGMKQVVGTMKGFERALPTNIKKGMRSAGVILERDMKRKVSGPGRKRTKGGAAFSRSNDFPGVVTNRLRSSIRFALTVGNALIIGARVKYDKFLEFGTRKMQAYAFVGPTWRDKGKAALAAIDKAILKPFK